MQFDDQWYLGQIVKHDRTSGQYHVKFTDGDVADDVDLEEMRHASAPAATTAGDGGEGAAAAASNGDSNGEEFAALCSAAAAAKAASDSERMAAAAAVVGNAENADGGGGGAGADGQQQHGVSVTIELIEDGRRVGTLRFRRKRATQAHMGANIKMGEVKRRSWTAVDIRRAAVDQSKLPLAGSSPALLSAGLFYEPVPTAELDDLVVSSVGYFICFVSVNMAMLHFCN